ncbi:MAG: YihY/virulence factor BrkB family protein [Salaquimonas sp.]
MLKTIRFWSHVLRDAFVKFNQDDGWAIASHIALSGLFALFPFLIFATSIAGFLELGTFADNVVHLIFDYWPEGAGEAIAREVRSVLTEQRGDFLTIGGLLTLYFASNGVEALRVALNRSYRQQDKRAYWFLRLQSLAFVLMAILVLIIITVLLVLLPLGWQLAQKYLPWIIPWGETIWFWRSTIAVIFLFSILISVHIFLPAGNRSIRSVMPGILFTLFCWMIGSIAFGMYLEQFADYVSTYAGLAGAMIGLIFLYMLGLIFILGGEINASAQRLRISNIT